MLCKMIEEGFLIQCSGELFEAVQLSRVFDDSKDFVDSIPLRDPRDISSDFARLRNQEGFDLKSFVLNNFKVPKKINTKSVLEYIDSLWPVLTRETAKVQQYDSLIHVPFPYIVPGGRFREFYYWDTYFTSVGLALAEKYDIIMNMIDNFVYLQTKIGLIPNGTRVYYKTRSQPPILGLLIDLIYEKYGIDKVKNYIVFLEKELKFWMSGDKYIEMPNGGYMSRYYDSGDFPREESFIEDTKLAEGLNEMDKKRLYRNLRSGAESGWDFSSRWLVDPEDLKTIRITDMIPVDLNCLLFSLASTISKYYFELKMEKEGEYYLSIARNIQSMINVYCWNEKSGFYFDYVINEQNQSRIFTMAGCVPLFVKASSGEQANKVEKVIGEMFLKNGGFVTTLNSTNQQWDSPNGWAPLQWFGVKGLLNYSKQSLAIDAAQRWISIVECNFQLFSKIFEKYDVVKTSTLAEGGEYPNQEGFGWTNGITLKFYQIIQEYQKNK